MKNCNSLWCVLKSLGLSIWDEPHYLQIFTSTHTNSSIPVVKIPLIEKKLKISISVSGDETYDTQFKFKYHIHLIITDGVYSLKVKPINKYFKSKEERDIVVYDDKGKCYSSDGLFTITDYSELSDYWKIRKADANKIKCFSGKSLKEIYNNITEQFDKLKEATKGKINLYKTGFPTKTIKDFVNYYISVFGINAEAITEEEYELIELASKRPSYVICHEGDYENVFCADQKASYPSMFLLDFTIPIRHGKWYSYTSEQVNNFKEFAYGFYKCKIEEGNKKFVYKQTDVYTQYELMIAKQLKLKITMTEGDNVYIYNANDRIDTEIVFGQLIRRLYELKEDTHLPIVKQLLSSMWGVQCKSNIQLKVIKSEDGNFDIDIDGKILEMYASDENTMNVKYVDEKKGYYSTNLARLKPFLFGRQKYEIFTKVINPYHHKIIRWMVDGGIFTEPIKEFIIENPTIGDIAQEDKWQNGVRIESLNKLISL